MRPNVIFALPLFCLLIIDINAHAGNSHFVSCQDDLKMSKDHCKNSAIEKNIDAKKSQYTYDSEVLQVQQMLSKLGYHSGRSDGIYGPMTKKAIEKFQFENGFMINDQITLLLIYRLKLKLSEK